MTYFNVIISEVTNLDKAWTKLVNGLSGQFCASLNFLDTTQAVSPKWSFQPRGITPFGFNSSAASEHFRSGTLPGENVCTENLTPWKKLLPCESKRGINHKKRQYSISTLLCCPMVNYHLMLFNYLKMANCC